MFANNPNYGSYSPYSTYGPSAGYNRYGSGYYGGGYGGVGSMGGGYYGNGYSMNPADPNNPHGGVPGAHESLFARMEQSTAATFGLLENIVMAFTGFSQMLESTFHATHSSFMAMVGVADHFSHLKEYLGKMLGILTLLRALQDQINLVKLWIGIPIKSRVSGGSLAKEFATAQSTVKSLSSGKRASRTPLFMFLLVMVGFPYLFHRLIESMKKKHALMERQSRVNAIGGAIMGPDGQPLTLERIPELEFARAVHDFNPDPANAANELLLSKGDLIAILSKGRPGEPFKDSSTAVIDNEWWRGRLQTGKMGWFPQNHVQILQKPKPLAVQSLAPSKALAAASAEISVQPPTECAT